jgi:probable selenium-dependent hydroxylase accessory protein YqeC
MNLIESFELKPREIISLVGGGGKTTLMFALARELSEAGHRVITTTTTKMYQPSENETPLTLLIEESQKSKVKSEWDIPNSQYDLVRKELGRNNHITIAAKRIPEGKLQGIGQNLIVEIDRLKLAPYIIIEADGAKHRPLKAPNTTEPVIPGNTTLVIPVMGIEALNCALTEEFVFRAEIASKMLGIPLKSTVTAENIAALLTHPQGITKGSPPQARIVPFINKMDLDGDLQKAIDLARTILYLRFTGIERVILGQANSINRPIRAVLEKRYLNR